MFKKDNGKTRIFLSVPMAGKTDDEIKAEMESIKKELSGIFDDFEIIDSFYY